METQKFEVRLTFYLKLCLKYGAQETANYARSLKASEFKEVHAGRLMKKGIQIAREELGDEQFFATVLEVRELILTSCVLIHSKDLWMVPPTTRAQLIEVVVGFGNPEYARAVLVYMDTLGLSDQSRELLQRLAAETEDLNKIFGLLTCGSFCRNLPEELADRLFGQMIKRGGHYYANYLLQDHAFDRMPPQQEAALRANIERARANNWQD